MTVYAVFIRESTRDPAELKVYGEKAAAARADHPMTGLVHYGAFETLEGAPIEGAVIISFPDMAAAKAWYYSPAYQEALPHRQKASDYRVFFIEGVAAAPAA